VDLSETVTAWWWLLLEDDVSIDDDVGGSGLGRRRWVTFFFRLENMVSLIYIL
jgi:hypothetical protein